MNSSPPQSPTDSTLRYIYNLFTDLFFGPNFRWKDNLLQGIIVATFFAMGASYGLLIAEDKYMGFLIGSLIGIVSGALGSGFSLMIFRGLRHMLGRHD
ncbi:hypothetical protein LOC68_15710 [Blastopirellula sp. JC732]|uniref:Uncharacterized protein n=1 Tax=Blastopirellula sediminis TaxID=2894196 RepID=A0A9X1MNJ2_9BACT|nr:hypothetical protein [Blastopirellula sediminis]MCC9606868.1 hypothetical protein [Blastopirellula sediminis]MCC9629836.1 hypothetical protein [Blastopirellula sediminis]